MIKKNLITYKGCFKFKIAFYSHYKFIAPKTICLFISTSTYDAYLMPDIVLSARTKSQTCLLASWSLCLVIGQNNETKIKYLGVMIRLMKETKAY